MAVQTTVQQPNPISPSCVCMQHAFGFMGASGRKSDLLKTKKKKKRKRIEEKMKRAVTRWKKNCSRGQRAGRVRATRAATVIQLQLRHADRSFGSYFRLSRNLSVTFPAHVLAVVRFNDP
ncbi:hypothetical protein ACS0PU_002807 [Formica fusca]